jgi:hypothetical protein
MKTMLDVVVDVAGRSASFFVPLLVLVYVYRRVCFWIALRWLPGPPALPILGNALLLTGGQDGKPFIRPLVRRKYQILLTDPLIKELMIDAVLQCI